MAWTPFNFFKYDKTTHDFSTTAFNIKQALNNNWDHVSALIQETRNKFASYQEKEEGKGLSTNDFDNAYKEKLEKETTYTESVMEVIKWDVETKIYSFEETYPSATHDVEIQPNSTCTEEEIATWGAAMITGSATSNVATAIGEIPTIDIPIIIKVVEK